VEGGIGNSEADSMARWVCVNMDILVKWLNWPHTGFKIAFRLHAQIQRLSFSGHAAMHFLKALNSLGIP
jgi:hypothetical protein